MTRMHPRAAALVEQLSLQPHREGGHFREGFRSALEVSPGDGRDRRSALTSIYFLLAAGEKSHWHQLRSDEVWHYCEGDPLELHWLDEGERRCHTAVLGPIEDVNQGVAIVPAGSWQAARSRGDFTLVGCTVGPGFDFADFRLLSEYGNEADAIALWYPSLEEFL